MKITQVMLCSLLILLFVSQVFSFDKKKIDDLMSKIQNKEYMQVEEFLNDNKEILKENPEYYVIPLNYVLSKGD